MSGTFSIGSRIQGRTQVMLGRVVNVTGLKDLAQQVTT